MEGEILIAHEKSPKTLAPGLSSTLNLTVKSPVSHRQLMAFRLLFHLDLDLLDLSFI